MDVVGADAVIGVSWPVANWKREKLGVTIVESVEREREVVVNVKVEDVVSNNFPGFDSKFSGSLASDVLVGVALRAFDDRVLGGEFCC